MVSQALPDSGGWKFLASLQTHVPWTGASLHDFIQPSFSFLVGVALPFSIASRTARGASNSQMTWHALWRALVARADPRFAPTIEPTSDGARASPC
jgi:hypothetical protein